MSRPTSDTDLKGGFQKLEKYLRTENLCCVSVPNNSFYRAVARQLELHGKHSYTSLRKECANYLSTNEVIRPHETGSWTDELKEVYLARITNPQQECIDNNVIQAAANVRKTSIKIYCSDDETLVFQPKAPGWAEPSMITIGRVDGTDYYSVEPKKEEKKTESPAKKDAANGKKKKNSESDRQANFEKRKKWEFEVATEQEDEKKDGPLLKSVTKLAKYITALVFFALVLLGGITTKSTLLVLGNAYSQDYSTSTCLNVENQYYHVKYMVMLIFMTCLCFPEVLALLFSSWEVIKQARKERNEKEETKRSDSSESGNGNQNVIENNNNTGGQNENEKYNSWISACLLGMIPEILHAVGLTFLTLKVIPQIDSTLAALTFSLVATVPAIINIIPKFPKSATAPSPENGRNSSSPSSPLRESTGEEENGRADPNAEGTNRNVENTNNNQENETKSHIGAILLRVIAVILLPAGCGLVCWQIYQQSADRDGRLTLTIGTAVCLVCISSRYWENFVGTGKKDSVVQTLRIKRFKSTIIYSLVRIGVIVACCFLVHFVLEENQSVVAYRGKVPVYFNERPRTTKKCSRLVPSVPPAVREILRGLGQDISVALNQTKSDG